MRPPAILLGLVAIAMLPITLPGQATIKITSPASDLVVQPGQTVDVEVSASGAFSWVGLSGASSTLPLKDQSLDSPPYLFHVTIPAACTLGRSPIAASLYRRGSPTPVVSDTVWVDVERPDSPRQIRITNAALHLAQVDAGDDLRVMGMFDAAGEVNLSRSSRTTYETDPPGIVSVDRAGQVRGLAPGAARILVRHQNLQAAVDVTVAANSLTITSPAEGTVVHPGETITVNVAPGSGPFQSVGALVPGYMTSSLLLKSPPYQFSFIVAALSLQTESTKIKSGPNPISIMGSTASGPVFAQPIYVDIEPVDSPKRIFADWEQIGLTLSVGGKRLAAVYGEYRDGSIVDLTQSSLTTYEFSSPGVASATKDGYVKGVAPGSTKLVIRNGDQRAIVGVVVTDDRGSF
jgi:hypothetical protein